MVGLAKTGTTVISKALQNTVGVKNYHLEPDEISFFEKLGRSGDDAVVKILYDQWKHRPRLFNAIVHDELGTKFERNIFITRDPRAEMVSRLNYLPYHYFFDTDRPSGDADKWVNLFRRKEADPQSLSLGEMIDIIHEQFGQFSRHALQVGASVQRQYANHLATIADERKTLVRYEDFVTGQLNGPIGDLLSGSRELGQDLEKTRRSNGVDDWGAFILDRDREWIDAALGPAVRALGYDPDFVPDHGISGRCSEYVERLIQTAISDRAIEKDIQLVKASFVELPSDGLPYPTQELMARSAGSLDVKQFNAVGEEFLGHLKNLCGLQPHHAVLDVGCGVGRIARKLTGVLSAEGSYRGFDVAQLPVEWCRKNITAKFPNFEFQHVDVANSSYNQTGETDGASFTFPYEDNSFDVVLLTSVFTHMLPEAMNRYMYEIARVLKPGGRSLITCFLLDDDLRQQFPKSRSAFKFPHIIVPGVVSVEHDKRPEEAVGYEEAYARSCYDAAGLTIIEPIHYGKWSTLRAQALSGQDIIVAEKKPT